MNMKQRTRIKNFIDSSFMNTIYIHPSEANV